MQTTLANAQKASSDKTSAGQQLTGNRDDDQGGGKEEELEAESEEVNFICTPWGGAWCMSEWEYWLSEYVDIH